MKNKILYIMLLALGTFIGLDSIFHISHGKEWWAGVPGFFALLAVIGGLMMAFGARFLSEKWLARKEDYYTVEEDDE